METLEELKAIIKNAPKNFNFIDGDGFFWLVTGVNSNNYIFIDGEYVETSSPPRALGLRSLSDIKRIIELREANSEAKKSALLSLKEAIEPDGLINSEAGLKTIRTIQNAIDNIVSHL